MKLTRFNRNPIFAPDPKSPWESACVCNPGAWYDGEKVTLLYRGGPDDDLHRIYFGLAESRDGLNFKKVSNQPVFGPSLDGWDAGCVEDPRIVKFGDTFFVTYAARMFPPGAYWKGTFQLNAFNPKLPPEAPYAASDNITRSGLAATKDFRTWHRFGPITQASVDNRDVIIFPERVENEFVMMHRPSAWVGPQYGCTKPSIWISFSDDLLTWHEDHVLAQPVYEWESKKIGGGTPPVRTTAGWLTLYHGVDKDNVYRVGALLLDLKDPLKIIARTPQPILQPEAVYERQGIIPNVVFPCGNVIIDEILYVYYGGADRFCCVATAPLGELLDHLLSNPWNG